MYGAEGSTVTLRCEIYKGITQVTWFKDDIELQLGYRYHYDEVNQRVRTVLVLPDFNSAAAGAYSCAAG